MKYMWIISIAKCFFYLWQYVEWTIDALLQHFIIFWKKKQVTFFASLQKYKNIQKVSVD